MAKSDRKKQKKKYKKQEHRKRNKDKWNVPYVEAGMRGMLVSSTTRNLGKCRRDCYALFDLFADEIYGVLPLIEFEPEVNQHPDPSQSNKLLVYKTSNISGSLDISAIKVVFPNCVGMRINAEEVLVEFADADSANAWLNAAGVETDPGEPPGCKVITTADGGKFYFTKGNCEKNGVADVTERPTVGVSVGGPLGGGSCDKIQNGDTEGSEEPPIKRAKIDEDEHINDNKDKLLDSEKQDKFKVVEIQINDYSSGADDPSGSDAAEDSCDDIEKAIQVEAGTSKVGKIQTENNKCGVRGRKERQFRFEGFAPGCGGHHTFIGCTDLMGESPSVFTHKLLNKYKDTKEAQYPGISTILPMDVTCRAEPQKVSALVRKYLWEQLGPLTTNESFVYNIEYREFNNSIISKSVVCSDIVHEILREIEAENANVRYSATAPHAIHLCVARTLFGIAILRDFFPLHKYQFAKVLGL